MDPVIYQSTQRYSVEIIVEMGVELYKVTDSTGMVVAILLESDFNTQFEVVP